MNFIVMTRSDIDLVSPGGSTRSKLGDEEIIEAAESDVQTQHTGQRVAVSVNARRAEADRTTMFRTTIAYSNFYTIR